MNIKYGFQISYPTSGLISAAKVVISGKDDGSKFDAALAEHVSNSAKVKIGERARTERKELGEFLKKVEKADAAIYPVMCSTWRGPGVRLVLIGSGPSPSLLTGFKKGDRLRIQGDSDFPFSVEVTVSSATHDGETKLLVDGKKKPTLYLDHFSDSDKFYLRKKYGAEMDVISVKKIN